MGRRAALLAIPALLLPGAPLAVAAPPGAFTLGVTTGAPSVAVDEVGITQVAFLRDAGGRTEVHVMRRGPGASVFGDDRTLNGLPGGQLLTTVRLVGDPVGGRLVLLASGPRGAGGVTFASTSRDHGLTWTPAAQVADVAVGADAVVRPTDGALVVTPGTTGVQRLVLPAALTPLQTAALKLTVTTRVATRTNVAQAAGPDGTVYTASRAPPTAATCTWGRRARATRAPTPARPGTGACRGHPRHVRGGGARGAGVLTADRTSDGPLRFVPLSPAGAGTPVVVPGTARDRRPGNIQLVTAGDGTFLAVWSAPEGIVLRRSEDGGRTWGGLSTVVTAAQGAAAADGITTAQWSAGGVGAAVGAFAYRDRGTQQVTVVRFDPRAVDDPGTPAATATPNLGVTVAATGAVLANLTGPRAVTRRVLARRGVVFTVVVDAPATCRLTVHRGGRVLVHLTARLAAGGNPVRLRTRRLAPGRYLGAVALPTGRRSVPLVVR
ncbi:MAG: sialidase family protein [Thermoleophilia bacterium]